uniref:Uncharacterized protein n=1 Tax=Brassica oleracea var. oleracea TaxID=109376 RepID=A0A0D2ZUZ1_BRAOL
MNFHDEILDLAPFVSSPIWREAYRLPIFPQNIGFELRQQRLKNLGLVKRPALQLAFLPPLRHLEFTFAMETQVAKIDPTYKKARLHPLRLILAIPNNSAFILGHQNILPSFMIFQWLCSRIHATDWLLQEL